MPTPWPTSPGPTRADGWVALVFGAALLAFVWLSWAAWPLLTADSARELYVPFQLRHGFLLYKDFAYLYGPVAPLLQAGLLALFGEHLSVLYTTSVVSLGLTLALLYTLARQLLPPLPAAMVLWIFLTHFTLGQDIWGYLWPYAFAATDGVLWGLALLCCLARHAHTRQVCWLGLGGVWLGLSLLTKQDFGAAALGIVGVYGGLRALARPGLRAWVVEALAILLPAASLVGLTAWAVLARMSWQTVTDSIWPQALMRLWNSQGTWHGTPASWLWNLEWSGLALGALALALGAGPLWQGLVAREVRAYAALLAVVLVLGGLVTRGSFFVLNAAHYWTSPGFLLLFGLLGGCAVALARGFKARLQPSPALVVWTLVGAYGCLAALRTLMLGYNDYTRYQAPVALIAWVGLAWALANRLPASRRVALGLLTGLMGLLGGQVAASELAGYMAPHEAVTSAIGTVRAPVEQARPFNAALAYVKAHTRPGDKILAGPMEADFYAFSGLDNVLHEDQLFWGYLTTPGEQRGAIARLEASQIRYVLLSNYGEHEHRFGIDYMQILAGWIHTHGRLVGDYRGARYAVQVYATPYARDIRGM